MNEVIRQLMDRKSVRAFTEQEISQHDKELILHSAMQAPTAGNQQMYTIIDVTSQELKDALVKTCDNQNFIAKGKMVLVFCADYQKWYDAFAAAGCEPRLPAEGDLILAVCDTMIAAQNAVVAAESLGIGSCYIGDVMENCEEQRKLLNLPEYVFPVGMLVFGYPTQQQIDRVKPLRADLKHIVHENSYRKMEADELKEMLSNKSINMSYEDWIHAFCKRKYNSDFSREMSRSVAKYIEAFKSGR